MYIQTTVIDKHFFLVMFRLVYLYKFNIIINSNTFEV